jgi:hypothetical protein
MFQKYIRCCTYCNGADGWRTASCHRALTPSSCGVPRPLLSSPLHPLLSLPFPPSRCDSLSSASAMTRTSDKRDAHECGGRTSVRRWWPQVGRWRARCSRGGPAAT